MNHTLEPRELDAIRYNTDGRCFRVRIEGRVLRLDRTAALHFWPEMMRIMPPYSVAILLCYAINPYLPSESWIHLVLLFAFMQLVAFFWSRILKQNIGLLGVKWVFDHSSDSLEIDRSIVARLSDIAGVIAWQKGKHRFLLALDFKDGKRIPIGEWCFGTKEFSWREDARTIADFLNVPLQIPDVFEV